MAGGFGGGGKYLGRDAIAEHFSERIERTNLQNSLGFWFMPGSLIKQNLLLTKEARKGEYPKLTLEDWACTLGIEAARLATYGLITGAIIYSGYEIGKKVLI